MNWPATAGERVETSGQEEGYEVEPTSSFVAPECEAILTAAIHQLPDPPPK